ncbi:MAG TPA: ROK family protein [Limnochordia bacterium]|nr:ROK family protein [Limnochordia bacterium]
MGRVLALDFGNTKLAAALVDGEGALLRKGRRLTPVAAGPDAAVAALAALGREVAGDEPFERIGLSFGGMVDGAGRMALESPNFPGWRPRPLAAELAASFGRPAAMENDANAAALGQGWLGPAAGTANYVYVTISTGVGGGVVLDGRLWRGAHGLSGEIGHLCIEPGGESCACGARGCLERCASGPAIVQAAERSGWRGADGAAGVAQAARAGDAAAQAAFTRAGRALGLGLAHVANLFDPELIVCGGGVTNAWDLLEPALQPVFAAGCAGRIARAVRIVRAAAHDDAGLIGAAAVGFAAARDTGAAGASTAIKADTNEVD